MSKYIGETEKNLARIFGAPRTQRDPVLRRGRRALRQTLGGRDSHDRYANIEIAYLLQQMEQFEGVAILATNLRQNMDQAFVRRLQFVVEFPFPDAEQRAPHLAAAFPDEADRDPGIDYDLLAGSSGSPAARSRTSCSPLRSSPRGSVPRSGPAPLHALRREYHKMGKVLTDAELAPYGELVAL